MTNEKKLELAKKYILHFEERYEKYQDFLKKYESILSKKRKGTANQAVQAVVEIVQSWYAPYEGVITIGVPNQGTPVHRQANWLYANIPQVEEYFKDKVKNKIMCCLDYEKEVIIPICEMVLNEELLGTLPKEAVGDIHAPTDTPFYEEGKSDEWGLKFYQEDYDIPDVDEENEEED